MTGLSIKSEARETIDVYTFYYGDGYDCNSEYYCRTLDGALEFLKNNVKLSKKEKELLQMLELRGNEETDFKMIDAFVRSLKQDYCDTLSFYRDKIQLW